MSESSTVDAAARPCTRRSLAADLRALGLEAGDIVLTHTSLSKLGWVAGGAQDVIEALLDVLGPKGTLAVPAFSAHLSDPAAWEAPPVPEAWWETIRAELPAFDRFKTPTRGMGRLPEQFRSWPGVLRSDHPISSIAAWGAQAEVVTRGHSLANSMGDGSPLARLEERGARVLLLGVGYAHCTCFHLAESRLPNLPRERQGGPVTREGERRWVWYENPIYDSGRFAQLGEAFEAAHPVVQRKVGAASARLFDLSTAVAFAEEWLPTRI